MYASVKEVHIVVYQRLQQIGSNYHQSIAPQFVDMVLNNAMRTVIRKKFDDRSNFKQEGFEESVQRYDDLQSLKRYTEGLPFNPTDITKGIYAIDLPIDYMNLISCKVSVSNGITTYRSNVINTSDSYVVINNDNNKLKVIVDIDDQHYEYLLSDYASSIKGDENKFVVINEIVNALKIIKEQSNYKVDFIVENIKDISNIRIKIINCDNVVKSRSSNNTAGLGSFAIRLVSSNDKEKLLDNHYYIVNAYKAPLAIIRQNKIVITNVYRNAKRYPNLTFSNPIVEYLAYPIEFNIDTNTMPTLSFIDDVVNTAVSDLLLIVKDPTVNLSKQSETSI